MPLGIEIEIEGFEPEGSCDCCRGDCDCGCSCNCCTGTCRCPNCPGHCDDQDEVEHDCQCHNSPATKIVKQNPDWDAKGDGSLDDGTEFVSKVLYREFEAADSMKSLMQSLIISGKVSEFVSVHIHVSPPMAEGCKLGNNQIHNPAWAVWMARNILVYDEGLVMEYTCDERRSRWCGPPCDNVVKLAALDPATATTSQVASIANSCKRYAGGNFSALTKFGTVEFRYFDGDENVRSCNMMIEAVRAISHAALCGRLATPDEVRVSASTQRVFWEGGKALWNKPIRKIIKRAVSDCHSKSMAGKLLADLIRFGWDFESVEDLPDSLQARLDGVRVAACSYQREYERRRGLGWSRRGYSHMKYQTFCGHGSLGMPYGCKDFLSVLRENRNDVLNYVKREGYVLP